MSQKSFGKGLCAVASIAGLCFAGYGILANRQPNYQKLFVQGKLPPLSGPYLSMGNPSTLHYEVNDLGIGTLLAYSSRGDLVYRSFGKEPKQTQTKDVDGFSRTQLSLDSPKVIVRSKEGIERHLKGNFIGLCPDGRVLTAQKNGEVQFYLDGNAVLSELPLEYKEALWDESSSHVPNATILPDGIIFGTRNGSTTCFAEWKGLTVSTPGLFSNSKAAVNDSYGPTFQYYLGGKYRYYRLNNKYFAGIPYLNDQMDLRAVASSDGPFLNSREKEQRTVPYRLTGTELKRIPVPQGSYEASVKLADSWKCYLLKQTLYNRNVPGIPLQWHTFVVLNDVGYSGADILRLAGLTTSDIESGSNIIGIYGDANLFVSSNTGSYSRLYSLVRKS